MSSRSSHTRRKGRRRSRGGLIALAILLGVVMLGWLAYEMDWIGPGSTPTSPAYRVIIGDDEFVVELALTPRSRFRGLSNRARLSPDQGMLFVFPEPSDNAFVMRECYWPIDVAFIDAQRRIITIHQMQVERDPKVPDEVLTRYPPDAPATYVLEVLGGELARRGIRVGDRVEFSAAVRDKLDEAR